MKKKLLFLCMFVMAFMLCGCSNVNNEEKENTEKEPEIIKTSESYEIDKEVEIKETINLSQAQTIIKNSEEVDDSIKYVTVEYSMTISEELTEGVMFTGVPKMVVKMDLSDGDLKAEGTISMEGVEGKIYVSDGYAYYHYEMPGTSIKQKLKIPEGSDVIDIYGEDIDINEAIEQLGITEGSAGLNIGYDSQGCLVFDYKDEEKGYTIRFVVDGNKPLYMFVENKSTYSTEMKYDYSEVTVTLPSDLDTYVEIEY